MSGLKGRERLQPSLLDRLTDHAPSEKRDPPDQQVLTMAQLRQAVLRDLAWLLNTTNLATLEEMPDTPLVMKSTVNYGIPGFAGLSDARATGTRLEKEIAGAIKAYEPRIRPETLKVRMTGANPSEAAPALVFEISGELWAQPVPVQLFVSTSIDVETRLAAVTDEKA